MVLLDYPGYGLSSKPDIAYFAVRARRRGGGVRSARSGSTDVALVTHDVGDSIGGEILAREIDGKLGFHVTRRVLTNGSIYMDLVQLTDGQRFLLSFPDPGLIILGDATAKRNAEIGRDPLWFVDGPDPRANSLVNETFTVIAEEYGASSVLTGEGGDFIFSGEVSVIDSLLRQRRFSEIYKLLREWSGGSMKEMLKLGFQYGIAPFMPYIGEKLYYDLLWSDTEYELPEYFTEEHRKREWEINKEDHLRYRKSRELSVWGKRFHYDFLWPRARYMDVGVTLHTYHPFLDRRLIEFSFSVPPEQHFDVLKGLEEHYAGSEMLFRRSFTDILPPYVYNRSTKTTYAIWPGKAL